MFKKIAFSLCATLCFIYADKSYDLRKFIAAIEAGNFQMKSSNFDGRTFESNEDAIENWREPQFSIQQFLEPIQTRVGNQNRKWSFKQELPIFNKYTDKVDKQGFQIQAQKLAHESLKIHLHFIAKKVFAHHIWLKQDAALLRELEELLAKKTEWLQAFSIDEVQIRQLILMLQIYQEELKIQIQEEAKNHQQHFVQLSHLIGLQSTQDIHFEDSYIEDREFLKDIDLLLEKKFTQKSNLNSQQANMMVLAKTAESKIETAKLWPKISVQLDYYELDQVGQDPYSVGIQMSLPIYRSKDYAKIRAKNFEVKSMQMLMKHYQLEYYEAWKVSQIELRNLKEQLIKYRDGLIPLAKELVRYSENLLSSSLSMNNVQNWYQAQMKLNELERKLKKIELKIYQEFAKLQWIQGDQNEG